MAGISKYIKTPDDMWQLFCLYRDWVAKNPINVDDWVGGAGKKVVRKKQRPLTMEGFENHCFEIGKIASIDQYFANYEGRYADFVGICSRIRKIIREEQITGGMAGIYNPSITQRLNNLVEKTENKHEVNEIVIKRES